MNFSSHSLPGILLGYETVLIFLGEFQRVATGFDLGA